MFSYQRNVVAQAQDRSLFLGRDKGAFTYTICIGVFCLGGKAEGREDGNLPPCMPSLIAWSFTSSHMFSLVLYLIKLRDKFSFTLFLVKFE